MTDRAPFIAAAERIGCQICRDAIWLDARCNWLGWSMEFRGRQTGGQWAPTYRALGSQLYDGVSGIGLFLARLSHLTGDAIIRATARGALTQAVAATDMIAALGEFGYYSGLAGIARTCMDAAPLLEDETLAVRGLATLLCAARIAPHPHRIDVINGSAGLIPVLVAAAVGSHRDELLTAAVAHADQLLARAERTDEGWSWNTLNTRGPRNLVGYSHGTAGIACALAELAQEVGRSDFREAAVEALRYERHYFVPAQGNWPDFRDLSDRAPTGEPSFMVAWCHGAPGIGIGRLRVLDALPDDEIILKEVDAAIATTVASTGRPVRDGIGNFSLCHGDAGNADFLMLAADRLGRPELRQTAQELGLSAIATFELQNLPWPCGVPGAGETPNLMLGLSGVGYFFLRLYDSKEIPSVLSQSTSL